ncbi:MAG: hypothetical protein QXI12_13390 [Candidatus Methanomethyliaceae archaeon]
MREREEMEGGRWMMEGGKQRVEGGRWKVESGRWMRESGVEKSKGIIDNWDVIVRPICHELHELHEF